MSVVTYTDARQTATLSVLESSDAPAATPAPAAASSSSVEASASSSTEEAAPAATTSSTYEAPASSSTYEEPSSTYVAPTSTYVAPTTSSTWEAPAATTAEVQNTVSTGGDSHYGQATYFYQNGNPGACGNYNSDSTPLVALPAQYWGNGGSQPSQYCGQYIQVNRNGRTVNAIVADLCPTCVGSDSIDLSSGAFNQIASPDEGSVSISWKFI